MVGCTCILSKVLVYYCMEYKIYTLSDPDTEEIRYIGKTKNSLLYRLQQHVYEAFRHKSHKASWVKSLLKQDKMPIIELLDSTSENWQELEVYWISQFKTWGFNLVNMTDGGDGNNNQVMTEETKKKISETLKGRKRPEDVIKKISESHKGKKLTKSTRQKLKNINLGKIQSEATKAKRYKSVLLISESGEIIERFNSLKEAAEKHSCRKGSISNVCYGRAKTACGYYWRFE